MIPPTRDGQGHQFQRPQSILSDALLWYGSQLGATPGGGSSLVAVRKWWQCAGTAVEPALRQVSYARCAQGSTGDCDQPSLSELWLGRPFSASLQQPVDFFCK